MTSEPQTDQRAAYLRFLEGKRVEIEASGFADCGIITGNAGKSTLRGVRSRVFQASVSIGSGSRPFLLESVFRQIETPRFGVVLRSVRFAVLSPIWGTGYRCSHTPILLARLLLGMAGDESKSEYLPKNGPRAYTSRGSRSGLRAAAYARRGGASYRPEQAKQSPVKSRRLPGSSHARELSSGRAF